MLLLLCFLNILEDSVIYLMYFSIFHWPCEQTILWLQLLIFCFISVSSKWLLDRPVFADGCYYGFETNVEQLYGARLSVSTAVSICFTDSRCKLVLIEQQGKIFFIQAESNIPPLADIFSMIITNWWSLWAAALLISKCIFSEEGKVRFFSKFTLACFALSLKIALVLIFSPPWRETGNYYYCLHSFVIIFCKNIYFKNMTCLENVCFFHLTTANSHPREAVTMPWSFPRSINQPNCLFWVYFP